MVEDNKWTKANRKERVLRVDVVEVPEGDLLRPKPEYLGELDSNEIKDAVHNGLPLWSVMIESQAGFDSPYTSIVLSASLEEAKQIAARYPVGSEIDNFSFVRSEGRQFELDNLSVETRISVFGRGDPNYGLAYNALHGAGVFKNYHLSKEVREWIGADGEKWLRTQFEDGWEVVAAMEYCVRNFHSTSMACIAARMFVADFLASSDFEAGYASRELEVLMGGGGEYCR